ncbi:helix-turn-helix transcriptional regulator [Treponema brennaborense]|uniref:HTH deoR-type domain-containing protein n=1 Tax=Treponema brennaborense (strain DSM 12168 / CIP 105900 / DD5/3) TaxID=906968 RepID=F4LJZ8_TREBD|nr:YafY family protein [Treponema brennaborense]AEE16478.1 hypothetical protein Trebr_1045 [Treponema brennaborense DSM 12168]
MKIDRLVSIIMLLLEKKRIGAQELSEQFEVSKRTIYRDIDALSMAGIPVSATSGAGGGFEIMPEYKIDKGVFSADDLSAILTGLTGLSDLICGSELANALAKVRRFVPSDRAKDIELKANQIHIDLTPWISNRNVQPYLEMIKTALQENRLISFDYADRRGNKTARIAEPYQLVLKSSRWYVQSYCRTRNDFRLFRLSRMSSLKMSEESFAPREFQEPILDTAEIVKPLLTTVKIRIRKSIMERVLDFCPYEDFLPDGDGQYTVDFPFIENDYYYDILLGFGARCECLAPPHVRAEMQRRICEMAAVYER